uniref:Uncharacterized protein n=1 Tax=Drosophila pseudoobscura pseudoobscura TaxID=46245 RepID=A0A0R3NXQ2_DROPS
MRNYCNNPTFDSSQFLATMRMWVRRFGCGVPVPSSCCQRCRACGPCSSGCSSGCSNGCSRCCCSCFGGFLETCSGSCCESCLDPAWFSWMAPNVCGAACCPMLPRCCC